jgi:hypothetical protein
MAMMMRRAEPSSCHSGVILRGSHAVLLCFCVMVMLQFLSRAPVFLAFPPPPPPPIVCPQPAPKAGGRGRCPIGYGSY